MNSHLGLNAFFCHSRYDVTDTWSHTMLSHISAHSIARASVLLLLELLFVRECVLSCPLLSADDIDMFVDFIRIS